MVTEEEPVEEDEAKESKKESEDEDGKVEDEKEEKKTKKIEKTVWDWQKINNVKPIWMRKTDEVSTEEYHEFYKTVTKVFTQEIQIKFTKFSEKSQILSFHFRGSTHFQDYDKPLSYVHFIAEGEVSFRSILYIPKKGPHDMFQNYGKVMISLGKIFIIWL